MPNLPIIDLRLAADPATAPRLRDQLLTAAHEVGFFYLVGHGLDAVRQTELINAARLFFALPEDEKRAIENVRSPHFRGWTRVGGERTQGRADWREQLDIGVERAPVDAPGAPPWAVLEGPNQWPASLPGLRRVVEAWNADLARVGQSLLQEWAEALGQDRHVFDAAYARHQSLTKIVRYPGREVAETGQGVGAHKDSGLLTLLFVEPGKGGLQVERDGRWIDAEPVEDAFIVNIGELLEVATDGYLVATKHRVIAPPAGEERISVPFFYNPGYDARIPKLTLPPALAARTRGVTQDAANVIHDTYGANALKSRLRAHPDVAALHHPHLVATAAA